MRQQFTKLAMVLRSRHSDESLPPEDKGTALLTSLSPPPPGFIFCPVAPFAAGSAGCCPSSSDLTYSARSRYSLNCKKAYSSALSLLGLALVHNSQIVHDGH